MPQRTFESIRRSREKGVAVYLTAFFMFVMIPVVGLAIDGGYAFVIRSRLSAAADAAALAGGRGINLQGTQAQANTQATTQATNYFNANFPSGYMNTATGSTRTITPTFTVNTDSGGHPTGVLTIQMVVQVQAPTYFMKWLGIPNLTINAAGTATRRNLVMELVLDESASMGSRDTSQGTIPTSVGTHSCEGMVYSTIQFLKYFSPYDTIGVIPFDLTVYDDNNAGNDGSYTASTNYWQSGSAGAAHSISEITCGSNTNTTAALYKAYQDIRTVNEPLAQNVIVLFTDGVPNGVNASFTVRTKVDSRYSPAQGGVSGGCEDTGGTTLCTNGTAQSVVCGGSSPAAGCVAGTASAGGSGTGGMGVCTTTTGTVNEVALSQTANLSNNGGSRAADIIFQGQATPSKPSGCIGYSQSQPNGSIFGSQTIAYIPNTDYFGNSTINLTNSSGSSVTSPWFQWIYGDTNATGDHVNYSCAPAGTPITSGNSLCKNLGGAWTSFPSIGAGADNNTFTGGPYMGFIRPDLPNSIGTASMTSATNQAYTIRADTTYNITIDTVYLQGNGSDPVDRSFLQIVSNQQNILPVVS